MSSSGKGQSTDHSPAEVGEPQLYHPKSFIGKYIWSQDAKVIAIQYAVTAIGIGLASILVHSRWLERAFVPYVVASQTIPIVALARMIMFFLASSVAAVVIVAKVLPSQYQR